MGNQTSSIITGLLSKRLMAFAALLLALSPALAQDVLQLEEGGSRYPLGLHLEYMEDANSTLTIHEIVNATHSNTFSKHTNLIFNPGYTNSTFWFRFKLRNGSSPDRVWLLESQYPSIDEIDFYLIDSKGTLHSWQSGDTLPFSQRALKHRNIVFEVPLQQGEEISGYVRIKSAGSMQLPLVLWSEQGFLEKDHEEQYFFGIYYGIILAMLLYNLLIYFSIRDKNYLYYIWYIGGWGLLQVSLNGLGYEYLWSESPAWNNMSLPFFMAISMFGIFQFTRNFLQLKENSRRFDLIFKTLLFVCVAVAIAALTLNYGISVRLGTGLSLLGTVLTFICITYFYIHGLKQAKYFMLAWSILFLGMAIYAIKSFGWLPASFITEYSMQIGSAVEIIFLSFALAHRMKILMDDNDRMQREATELLEKRVLERTQELKVALADLSTANEKLKDLSVLDGLTGVKNRKYFNERHLHEWKLAYRGKYPLALLLLDIDHFKRVNDTHGHLVGDEALKYVAGVIKANLKRPSDEVARYGGEEFAIILPYTDTAGAIHLAEKIRRDIEATKIQLDKTTLSVTTSIGICSMVPENLDDPNCIISAADSVLYEAKEQGRNRVCVYAK